jgi:hypothetical protein
LEDEDRADIAAAWLSRLDDILGNRELAKVTMEQSRVSEAQLHYLYQNKDRIASLLEWDADKVNSSLYRKMFNLAVADEGTRGNAFETTIASFDKSMVNYARKDLEIYNAINQDRDMDRVVEIFKSSLSGVNRLSLEEFCNLLIDYSPYLETAHVQDIQFTLESYKFSQADLGKECWLYLAQLICYSKAGDAMNAKAVGVKAYHHENTPASYKKILKESFGIT